MRIVIDTEACTGHGRCYSLVPDLFEDDEYGHGKVRGDGVIRDDQKAAAQQAIASCPERAISLVE